MFIVEVTVSNIVLFAGVGASAIILSNTKSHHLTKLHTAVVAYLVAIVIATLIYYGNFLVGLPLEINLFLVIFAVGLAFFIFDGFHPSAISAAVSFFLGVIIIVLFLIIRLLACTFSQHFSIKEFYKELRKES